MLTEAVAMSLAKGLSRGGRGGVNTILALTADWQTRTDQSRSSSAFFLAGKGLVERRWNDASPPAAEYRLTPIGEQVRHILKGSK